MWASGIIGLVLFIIALIGVSKRWDNGINFMLTLWGTMCLCSGFLLWGNNIGERSGQIQALKGYQQYEMKITYELRDTTYVPIDTTYIKLEKSILTPISKVPTAEEQMNKLVKDFRDTLMKYEAIIELQKQKIEKP